MLAAVKESEVADMFFKILALCHTVIVSSHHKLDMDSEDSENESDGGEKGEEGDGDEMKKIKKKKKKGGDKEKQRAGSSDDGYSTDVEADGEGEGEGEGEELVYQAASPDEAALVSAARNLGYTFSVSVFFLLFIIF